ncbi:MAG: AAA family ATPase [Candidatus Helarchaeota archaeon]|nr:AAA family ATPase [Candidatus Helarchaeota archaeon]
MVSKILTNPGILKQLYIPEKVIHREKEFSQLVKSISLVNTFVHGPIGSGKILLLKRVILNHNETKKDKIIYMDCSLYQTTNAIFHETLRALNRVVVSKSNYELTKRLRVRLRHLDYRMILCLDHFERLKEVETINRILSLGLGLIIVAESFDAYRRLNLEAKSNVANIIKIPSYTIDQTFDILKERAEQAFEKYTYSNLRSLADEARSPINDIKSIG